MCLDYGMLFRSSQTRGSEVRWRVDEGAIGLNKAAQTGIEREKQVARRQHHIAVFGDERSNYFFVFQ